MVYIHDMKIDTTTVQHSIPRLSLLVVCSVLREVHKYHSSKVAQYVIQWYAGSWSQNETKNEIASSC